MLVLHEGHLVGLDAVGHPDMWKAVARRALWSFLPAATDGAVAAGARSRDARPDAAAWLQELRAVTVVPRPAVGMGEDLEIRADDLVGSGVWMGGAPAHVSVFAGA